MLAPPPVSTYWPLVRKNTVLEAKFRPSAVATLHVNFHGALLRFSPVLERLTRRRRGLQNCGFRVQSVRIDTSEPGSFPTFGHMGHTGSTLCFAAGGCETYRIVCEWTSVRVPSRPSPSAPRLCSPSSTTRVPSRTAEGAASKMRNTSNMSNISDTCGDSGLSAMFGGQLDISVLVIVLRPQPRGEGRGRRRGRAGKHGERGGGERGISKGKGERN